MNTFLRILKNHWISLTLVTAIAVALSVAFTATQPFEYRSAFSVLVIERTGNVDAYAAAKSAERASMSLGQILYTTSFYDAVRESGLVDTNVFPVDETSRRQMWERQIETRVFPDVGILKIASYDKDKERATSLSFAIATVLTRTGSDYLGTGKNIVLKVVDAPLTSKSPVRPNILMNIALGILIGFGGTFAIHLVREMQKQASMHSEGATTVSVPIAQPQVAQAPQPAWQPPMPVITTMFTPEAVAQIRHKQTPPQPRPSTPESWEMPDIRHRNSW